MRRLEGKVAIITGAGQGVGRGLAAAMAKEGAHVVLAGRTEKKVQQVADELVGLGLSALAIRCDVAIRADVERTVAATVEKFGTVDILVNNAFCGNDPMPAESTPEEYLRAAVQTNLFGLLYFTQACFPYLKVKGGRVINFATGAGIEGWAYLLSYAATKEGIRAMTRVMANEWGKYRITVNVLAPMANSPAMKIFEESRPEEFAKMMAATPLGYVGDCEADIGPIAVFIASDEGRYLTGHTFTADGGRFMLR
jgi:NAD(P)-dependent dehydrogenase (short-subunit alcohol dehydrogenase family)